MEFRDPNVTLRDDMTDSYIPFIIYGGWFLTRDDAEYLEKIARDMLDAHDPTIVKECGHLTHTFCGKNPEKKREFYRHLTENMPSSVSIQLIGLSHTKTPDHFISAFVPDQSSICMTTNTHPHITALRLETTPAVRSNDMLANPDGATRFVEFSEPIRVTLYAGAVVSRKPNHSS